MYSINESEITEKKLEGRSVRIIDKDIIECKNLMACFAYYYPEEHPTGHIHETAEELIYCIKGSGEIVIDGNREKLSPGTIVVVPPKKLHSINNKSKTEIKLYCVFSPGIKVGEYKNYKSN